MKAVDSTSPRVLAILLRSVHDFTPGQRDSTRAYSLPKLHADGSPWAASAWTACKACGGSGEQKRGKHVRPCGQCEGRGQWRADPYDESGQAHETVLPLTLQELEKLCAPLDPVLSDEPMGATALGAAIGRVPPAPERGTFLDALERDAHFRGDRFWFRGLQHALQALRLVAPVHWSAVDRAFVTQLEPVDRMGRRDQLLALDGLLVLAACLPDGWRAPRWARDQAEAELAAAAAERKARNGSGRWGDPEARRVRDREIARLAGQGFGARAIGRRLSVSHSTVVRVLQGREAA